MIIRRHILGVLHNFIGILEQDFHGEISSVNSVYYVFDEMPQRNKTYENAK